MAMARDFERIRKLGNRFALLENKTTVGFLFAIIFGGFLRPLEMDAHITDGTSEKVDGIAAVYGENGYFGLGFENHSIFDDIFAGIAVLTLIGFIASWRTYKALDRALYG